ncbi:MAG: GNAT family N-acetyltransferase [Chitinophagales bacterium]|nr:GNAT family N-acetyltransferase [Bacteroidota bacterium]MCB9044055.1 GNAT family N-acetyltransferase [Chitinophagales bacterium]
MPDFLQIHLRTERLYLRSLQHFDTQAMQQYFTENLADFQASMPKVSADFLSIAYQQQLVQQHISLAKQKRMLHLLLFVADNEQAIIGDICFSQIIFSAFRSCFVGYKTAVAFQRKGFMYEALCASLHYIFTQIGLHRVEANIIPFNEKSIALVEKIGFEKEGYSHKYLQINGTWEDHLRYAILAENFVFGKKL